MPTIYTIPPQLVYESGKSLGQIEREKEAYERSVEQARLDMQRRSEQESNRGRVLGSGGYGDSTGGGRRSSGGGSRTTMSLDDKVKLMEEEARIKDELEQKKYERDLALKTATEQLKTEKTQEEQIKESKKAATVKRLYSKYKKAGETIPSGLQREIRESKISKEELGAFTPEEIETIKTPDKAYVEEAEAKVSDLEARVEQENIDTVTHRRRVIAMANKLKQQETKNNLKARKVKSIKVSKAWYNAKK